MSVAQKRQSIIVYISMIGLAFTGFLLGKRNPEFSGLLSFETTCSAVFSVKHILMIVIVGLALYNSLLIHGERHHFEPQRKKTLRFSMWILGVALLSCC